MDEQDEEDRFTLYFGALMVAAIAVGWLSARFVSERVTQVIGRVLSSGTLALCVLAITVLVVTRKRRSRK